MWNIFGNSDILGTLKRGDTLPGRSEVMPLPDFHYVKEVPLVSPFPEGSEHILFGMGCFWGAERKFWEMTGVYTTAVGYVGGYTPNPTYQEVCSGQTGHTEAILVVFFPAEVNLEQVLRTFWENHDPTQGMRQGNDIGTQYRSGIYFNTDLQRQAAEESRVQYQNVLAKAGFDHITTEIVSADHFYYAEEYHQQYLAKNPGGYCGLGGTGVACPSSLTE